MDISFCQQHFVQNKIPNPVITCQNKIRFLKFISKANGLMMNNLNLYCNECRIRYCLNLPLFVRVYKEANLMCSKRFRFLLNGTIAWEASRRRPLNSTNERRCHVFFVRLWSERKPVQGADRKKNKRYKNGLVIEACVFLIGVIKHR